MVDNLNMATFTSCCVLLFLLTTNSVAFILDNIHMNNNFELGWHNYTAHGAHMLWSVHTVGVGSTTFPHTDHTYNTLAKGHVAYLYATSLARVGEKANLTSSSVHMAVGSKVSAHFWVQGKGSHQFKLRVFMEGVSTSHYTPMFTGIPAVEEWTHICIHSTVVRSSVSLRFETEYTGTGGVAPHMALDDVVFTAGETCTQTKASVSCNFDHDTCGWVNAKNDTFNWLRHQAGTASLKTGPTKDHTSGHGYYMFIETSSPRVAGDKALLESPPFPAIGNQRVAFWYNMHGVSIGTLNVYLQIGGLSRGRPVFTDIKATTNATWQYGCVNVAFHASTAHVIFEGIRGTSYTGDIAIDDVLLEYGSCTSSGGSTIATPVDGHWGAWGSYSTCSVTCGQGHRTSHRYCNSPAPSNGGHTCSGVRTRTVTCNTHSCIQNGGWSVWGTWSKCTTSCDMGVISRVRSCDHPAPYGGGKPCTGDSKETRDCSHGPCPQWSHWYDGTCSVTCGNGTQERVRQCSSGTNSQCAGNSYETVPCEGMYCL